MQIDIWFFEDFENFEKCKFKSRFQFKFKTQNADCKFKTQIHTAK